MVQSLNTKVDLVEKATSFLGFTDYGKIMIGDKGFEFYDDRKAKNFIQIPWEEIDCVITSVMFKGKWIPRFAVKTKRDGTFTFSAKDPKKVLRGMREYIGSEKIVRSLSFFQVIKRGVTKPFIKK
ncbi:DUF956 family protein [Vagococcus fluvialis]|jgi:hypothetical protein|uniref:DUF956 domain-containing protein n=1 Tax=Vagococcus fluvialis TaxID=2738 RepID=A0A369AV05_9ENTE|nr:DUF956 family protein [Vagococcus fluvialis]MBO0437581.1 DUF956 family protein [Vagococcus fluvialis]MBO0444501.1 DUF956 family protein [Vagococcus fluvialis]MBO0478625.1 DUF956 family protein [Vagococcus fluvialis]MBO0485511.1 DUF956 family protein [Vagococcus fluvialis]MBO0488364.1 DUF956 family protein [Vagococcus fluvialis]